MKYIRLLKVLGMDDVPVVGGKNASLGQMIQHLTDANIQVPGGFAVTADAYWFHLDSSDLRSEIADILKTIDKNNLRDFQSKAAQIRDLIHDAPLPQILAQEIKQAYADMEKEYGVNVSVAARSSATAEDLPHASFAGQQETFLNVVGAQNLCDMVVKSFASLFTDRAISYRIDHRFDHMAVALSVGVQKMVRSDKASAGVAFTLDTESGHPDVVMINSSYGLGESVVKGEVNPDEFFVHKPTLEKGFKPLLKKRLGSKLVKTVFDDAGGVKVVDVDCDSQRRYSLNDEEILELARYCVAIEQHYTKNYGRTSPMDIEWAKDGDDGKIYIVQARPETVHSQKSGSMTYEEYRLDAKPSADPVVTGKSIGAKIVSGTARVMTQPSQMHELKDGEILIADMTDPDWEPIMKRAGGIITNRGGRTCHAAIVSRELGIPAIVGTNVGTQKISAGDEITLDCSRGEQGNVYAGALPFTMQITEVDKLPELSVEIMVNVGSPDEAFRIAQLPAKGVGLARLEFIINSAIRIHPMALIEPEKVTDEQIKKQIQELTAAYDNKLDYFVDTLAQEVGTIAAAFYPRSVVVRLSDFKSNEYARLIGGTFFEPDEENPMIGFRGASRYYHDLYKDAFKLECRAMKKVVEVMGLDNIRLMAPFVRTVQEGRKVVELIREHGLSSTSTIPIYMMVEVPSNVLLIEQFAAIFDGFSIGSNDLTQLTLAVDRDSALVAPLFDERDEAVKKMLTLAIAGARAAGKPIGICGQAPSDFPEIAHFLREQGITSISLNPDTVISTWLELGT